MGKILNGETCVVAVGGNAVEDGEEIVSDRAVAGAMRNVVQAFGNCKLAIVHGNGPQYGYVLDQLSADLTSNEVVRFTQDWIGGELMAGLTKALQGSQYLRPMMIHPTRVLVDENDPSFEKPCKGVGRWLTDSGSFIERGLPFVEHPKDRGRFREAVASPEPKGIIGVEELVAAISKNTITICGGGGGVPVVEKKRRAVKVVHMDSGSSFVVDPVSYFDSPRVKAVVDKDKTANLIAQAIGARALVILTAVDGYYDDFGGALETFVPEMEPWEALQRVENYPSGNGSMNPKLEAAARFASSAPGRLAVITSIDQLPRLAEGDFSRATRISE